jgi:hypothetical protein
MKKFLLIAFSLALMAAPAWGASAPIFPGSVKSQHTSFVEGTDSAGTYKTIYTGGASGSKIIAIIVTTTDTTAQHSVQLQYSDSTTDHCATATTCAPLAETTPELGAGFGGDDPSNLLDNINGIPLDSDGNDFFFLKDNTDTLEATFATALTAGTRVNVTVLAVDF